MVALKQMLLSTLLLSTAVSVVGDDSSPSSSSISQRDDPHHHRELQNFNVRAYRCNDDYQELSDPGPLEGAPEFRVCLQPDTNTINQGVSILKLNTFKFYMPRDSEKTLVQTSVDNGSATDMSVLDCPGGKDVPCSFTTRLRENFFYQDGTVEGVGSIALQYNPGGARNLRTVVATGTASTATTTSRHRQTQEFAGLVGVNLFIPIEDGFDKKKIDEARQNFNEHWNEQPAHIQGLYISGLLVLCLIIFCCCGGMILWKHCCADIPGNWIRRERDPDEIHVMPPVVGKTTEDDQHSETYSLEDDDLMAGEVDEEESSSEEEESAADEESQQPPASYISSSRQLEDERSAPASEYTPRSQTVVTEQGLVPYDDTQSKSNRSRSSRR